jgi:hypothetical protein
MLSIAELKGKDEQVQLAWVATANLHDLRLAQLEPLNAGVLVAIQAKVGRLEDAERSRRILVVTVLTLVVSAVGAAVGVAALILRR